MDTDRPTKDVHTEHCCAEHGCKYRDRECTVVTGTLPATYECEDCIDEEDRLIESDLQRKWNVPPAGFEYDGVVEPYDVWLGRRGKVYKLRGKGGVVKAAFIVLD